VKITKKISDLNYEIADKKGKRQVVHVNRLKEAYNLELWRQNGNKKPEKNAPKRVTRPRNEKKDSQAEFKFGPYQLVNPQSPEVRNEHEPQADHSPALPDIPPTPVDTPIPDRIDKDYFSQTVQFLDANCRLLGPNPLLPNCVRKPIAGQWKSRGSAITVRDL
jgi:hypothetical protein